MPCDGFPGDSGEPIIVKGVDDGTVGDGGISARKLTSVSIVHLGENLDLHRLDVEEIFALAEGAKVDHLPSQAVDIATLREKARTFVTTFDS